ncbi:putative membrane-bound O-acyltransferase C24H6.01c [Morella rubra]|uniref:Putative membrane-bound O-acyltransferase C24H6.01c n=1 Tax=Morella rubra TaxID=262757 RepID=A0A6A1UJ39_9ROSI|nr:putative membrane-bound O-acyltransferase C24H6.01c [Morella rubra]
MKKNDSHSSTNNSRRWKRTELVLLILYAIAFYLIIIRRSLHLSRDHYSQLYGLRPGWLTRFTQRPNDVSDAQWRSFRGNLPLITVVFGMFTLVANTLRAYFDLKARGMSIVWIFISLIYLSYLHGACIVFILSIASINYLLVKIFARKKYFALVIWGFNIFFLVCNRVYGGYSFSILGQQWTYLDNFRGAFRWHICFNFVVLRMISFGYDYHWADQDSRFDQKKHTQRCHICKPRQACYHLLQERSLQNGKYTYSMYICYLVYAPLYLAGPIISFNAFASQLGVPQTNYSARDVTCYGLRWVFSLVLMELMTHLFHFNAFTISVLWKKLSPMDMFVIGYGAAYCQSMVPSSLSRETLRVDPGTQGLKFHVAEVLSHLALFSVLVTVVRSFKLQALVSNAPEETLISLQLCACSYVESSPQRICQGVLIIATTWKVFGKTGMLPTTNGLYMYIPLGGSQKKLLNVWIIFTFVAIWHDLEWKLLSWAWLTCLFFVPEMILKSAASAFQVESAFGEFVFRELRAVAGAITITCLMVANLVGYVIGPSGMNWLISQFLQEEGLSVVGGMLMTFYVGTKLMFHIDDAKQRRQ